MKLDVFKCLEFDDLPLPVFTCPECGHDTLIPVQVIEETEERKRKKVPLDRPFKA